MWQMALDAPHNTFVGRHAASLPCAAQAPIKLLVKEAEWGK